MSGTNQPPRLNWRAQKCGVSSLCNRCIRRAEGKGTSLRQQRRTAGACLFPSHKSEYHRRVKRGRTSSQRPSRNARTEGPNDQPLSGCPPARMARVRHYANAALGGSARRDSRGVCRHNLLCGVKSGDQTSSGKTRWGKGRNSDVCCCSGIFSWEGKGDERYFRPYQLHMLGPREIFRQG